MLFADVFDFTIQTGVRACWEVTNEPSPALTVNMIVITYSSVLQVTMLQDDF